MAGPEFTGARQAKTVKSSPTRTRTRTCVRTNTKKRSREEEEEEEEEEEGTCYHTKCVSNR